MDKKKLALLYGFCRHIGTVVQIGKQLLVARPSQIKWQIIGKTRAPFEFPIYQLHADGEAAIECAGLKMFYHKNLRLPEKIGAVKVADWKPEWILEEQNQEIRRCLLENIPSEKVANILQLKTLDKFKTARSEYELVEAKNNPYPSRYRALRFNCPTTNKPYLVRVHPDMDKAEAAIVSLNCGVHPDKFIWEH